VGEEVVESEELSSPTRTQESSSTKQFLPSFILDSASLKSFVFPLQ